MRSDIHDRRALFLSLLLGASSAFAGACDASTPVDQGQSSLQERDDGGTDPDAQVDDEAATGDPAGRGAGGSGAVTAGAAGGPIATGGVTGDISCIPSAGHGAAGDGAGGAGSGSNAGAGGASGARASAGSPAAGSTATSGAGGAPSAAGTSGAQAGSGAVSNAGSGATGAAGSAGANAVAASGSGGGGGGQGGVGGNGAATAGSPAPDAPLTTDGQVGAVITALHLAEIRQGRLAPTRASAPEVLAFAARLVSEHNAAASALGSMLDEIGVVRSTVPLSQRIVTESTALEAELTALNGPAFDSAYLAARVAAHVSTLSLLDERLLPVAQAIELRETLMAMRMRAESDLAAARTLGGQ